MANEGPMIVIRDMQLARYGRALDERRSEPALDAGSADYWRSRERSERAAAKTAKSSVARAIHQELAQQHAARVRGLEVQSRLVGEQR